MSAVAFGYAVFGDFPDHATWAGAGLIIVAGIVIALREQRLR
jgi:drug/metabolite transporter (DMT)-like permease